MVRTKSFLPPKPGKTELLIKQKGAPSNVATALAGMKGGESRSGFLGEGNIIRKPDFVVSEDLGMNEKAQKKMLQTFLGQVIEPTALSSKSSPSMDRRALVNKLNRSTLSDLLRLVPERLRQMSAKQLEETIATNSIMEEEKADIQNLYMDASP